jgi:hypothetical protein
MKLIYAFLFLFSATLIFAQSISLRGKVIDIDKRPVKNLPVRFTSFGESVTTGSGEFVITIPQSVQFIDIVIIDENWQLLYPIDAKIPVPSDPNFVTTVIVSKNNSSTGKSLDESMVKYNELESILKDVGTTNTELKSFFEKFIELEAKRLEISEIKLKEEFEKEDRRNEIFSDVSPVFKEYILRVKNLKTSFEMNYESAFVSNPSVEYLNSAIGLYNPSFDTINNNYNKWQKEISIAWDEMMSESFAASVKYMIDEIHKPYIFQLNEDTRLINNVKLRIGEGESRPDELKEEVIQSVSSILKNLEIKIPILENRFNEILTRMQHSGMN